MFDSLTPMLKARNLKETIEFYVSVLGFEVENQTPPENPTWCSLIHRSSALKEAVNLMFYTDIDDGYSEPSMSGVLYFRMDHCLELFERIKGKATVLWGPEHFDYNMLEFAIRDCNGYTFSFGQAMNSSSTPKNDQDCE